MRSKSLLFVASSCRGKLASLPRSQKNEFPLARNFGSGSVRWHTRQFGTMSTNEDVKLDDKQVRERTLEWLQIIVIGLNLCPFAEKPFRDDRLKVEIVRGCDENVLLEAIARELVERRNKPGTTLVVCPECFPGDFERYLDVFSMVDEGLLPDLGDGLLQVAPFHSLFQFQDSETSSVDNWTNRSPFPIFHILREDEVSRAVERLDGDAARVWRRNVELMRALERALGREALEALFQGKKGLDEELDTILRRFRFKLSDSRG